MLISFSPVQIRTRPTSSQAGACVLCVPPPLFGCGGGTLVYGRGSGGVPFPTREQTLWYSRYICTFWSTVSYNSSQKSANLLSNHDDRCVRVAAHNFRHHWGVHNSQSGQGKSLKHKTHTRQCKMSSSLKNWHVKGLCGRCLSVPYPIRCSHRGRGESWTKEKVIWATVHKDGSKIPTWMTVSPDYKLWSAANSLYRSIYLDYILHWCLYS